VYPTVPQGAVGVPYCTSGWVSFLPGIPQDGYPSFLVYLRVYLRVYNSGIYLRVVYIPGYNLRREATRRREPGLLPVPVSLLG